MPGHASSDVGNILNTSFKPVCFKQPLQVYPLLPTKTEVAKVFLCYKKLQMVYSQDEELTCIDNGMLNCIPLARLHTTFGRHSPFLSRKTDFFKVLTTILTEIEPPALELSAVEPCKDGSS